MLTFVPTASDTAGPRTSRVLLYDELLLATGLQPATRHLQVVLAPRVRLVDGEAVDESDDEGRGGRGGSGAAEPVGSTDLPAPYAVPLSSSSHSLTASPSAGHQVSSPFQPPHQLLRSSSDHPPSLRSSSDAAPSSAASSRPLSAAPQLSERPLSASSVNGVLCMGSEESGWQLLKAVHSRRLPLHKSTPTSVPPSSRFAFSPSFRVVVSGSSLSALTVLGGPAAVGGERGERRVGPPFVPRPGRGGRSAGW